MNYPALAIAVLAVYASNSTGPLRREADWGSVEVAKLAHLAYYDYVLKGQIPAARRIYEHALSQANANHYHRAASRILNSLANCDLAQQDYGAALEKYFAALELANQTGDCEQIALLHGARSIVYLQLFNTADSLQEAEALQQLRPCMASAANRIDADFQLASLYALESGPPAALPLFSRGIADADRAGDAGRVADGWHRVGSEFLRSGNLDRAEGPLSRAFAIRRLSRDPRLFLTTFALAELKLRQGDTLAARNLVDSTFQAATGGHLPSYLLYHLRARVRLAQGDVPGAIEDFRAAMNAAAEWRVRVLPVDSFRTGVDVGLHKVYASFIPAAVERYLDTHDPSMLEESWQAAELQRAASLQETAPPLDDAARGTLGQDHRDTLAQLHNAETPAFARSTSADSRLAKIRLRLNRIEAKLGVSLSSGIGPPENLRTRISLIAIQRILGDSRTLMSFHLGDRASYRWTVTSRHLRLSVLPPARELTQLAASFHHAVEADHQDAPELGHRLYDALFSNTGETTRQWMLALDTSLFQIPFAALVSTTTNGAPRFLVEDHSIEILPGAWAIGPSTLSTTGLFVGLGDPIYNRADIRYQPPSALLDTFSAAFRKAFIRITRTAELPRLAGSANELVACSRLWLGSTSILTGADATGRRLAIELSRRPAVLHIATHFVESPLNPSDVSIALGIQPGGSQPSLELLTCTDVAALRIPGSLIVLSGCHSAAGLALPGAGLLGLTRAFLAAGASGVIGSLWPTPDDAGELFTRFYTYLHSFNLGQPPALAEALQSAQLDMLHSSGWRATSRYWAAYQLTSRSNAIQ